MNCLLDTHVLLWWLEDNPSLSDQARAVIADGRNPIYISAVVIWEIRIKQALGKLDLPPHFRQVLADQPFEYLAITADHAHAVYELPMHHRDPFDRMLIAQARTEGWTLLSRDRYFEPYGVALIKA